MEIMLKLGKIGVSLIYPILLFLLLYYIYKKPFYNKTIKSHYKVIVRNTIIISFILLAAILIYFHFEDTIYQYDYSGHWYRSLFLRAKFDSPVDILNKVYLSMNYDDYSFLPALFQYGFTLINTSYTFFVISIFISYLLPIIVLLQVLYFKYINKYSYLPIFIILAFYPLYLTIFYGKVDVSGLLFLLIAYMIILLPEFNTITLKDNLLMNLLAFFMVFLRRWYLYPLVALYICYFIKYLFSIKFKITDREAIVKLAKIILSGVLFLLTIVLFFRPFLTNIFTNDLSEAYEFWDRGDKLLKLVNFFSPLTILISLLGLYKMLYNKKTRVTIIYVLISTILPLILFWNIQALEYHHYYIIVLPFLVLLVHGILYIFESKLQFARISIAILLIQAPLIFTSVNIPLFTEIKKLPEVQPYKDELASIADYLSNLMGEWDYAYMATGNYQMNAELLRNVSLPEIKQIQLVNSVLDLRDGFPTDFQYIKYIIISDPILYLGEPSFQRIYEIITNAITTNPLFDGVYSCIYDQEIDGIKVYIYEKIGEINQIHKEHFYSELLKYYPDKSEFFKYILD